MDETAVSARGGKHYLHRAVENDTEWPRTVNPDSNLASHLALRMLGEKDPTWQRVVVWDHRYLNYVIEQEHRAIKSRCVSM